MLIYDFVDDIFSSSKGKQENKMIKQNKSPKLTMTALFFLFMGLASLIIKNFMPEYVNAQGMLIEPYFFMIPIGFLLVFIGLIIGSIAFIRNMSSLKNK